MKHKYVMLVERNDGHLWGYFPDLPGCTTGGATKTELLENAKEALALYFEDYRSKGTPLPQGAAPEEMVFVEIDEGEIDQLVQPRHKLEARS